MILRSLLALAIFLPALARADAASEASQEMQLAQEALDRSDFPAALQHFSAARTLAPSASGPLLGLGLTYAGLDRCGEAVPLLEEYLRRKTQGASPNAARAIDDCKRRPSNGKLILESRPTAVEVHRDIVGQPLLGTTPLVVELPVGRHTLLLRKKGFLPSTVTVTIRPGQETRELAGLRSEEHAAEPDEPIATTTPPPRPPQNDLQLTAPPPQKKSNASLGIGLGVGLGVVVVVAVIVGAILGTRKSTPAFPDIVLK